MTADREPIDREPKRGAHGRFERTQSGAQRDAEAVRMRSRGATYQRIADALGYGSRYNARRAVERALAEIPADAVDELRRLAAERLDYLTRKAFEVLDATHYVHTPGGKLVHGPDGRPLLDPMPVLHAIDRLLRIDERRARLFGLDAPARDWEPTIDEIDAAIAELETQFPGAQSSTED